MSYHREKRTDPWTVLVDGKAFALGERRKQNNWVVHVLGRKYRGRSLQPAVMDAVRNEFRRIECQC